MLCTVMIYDITELHNYSTTTVERTCQPHTKVSRFLHHLMQPNLQIEVNAMEHSSSSNTWLLNHFSLNNYFMPETSMFHFLVHSWSKDCDQEASQAVAAGQ